MSTKTASGRTDQSSRTNTVLLHAPAVHKADNIAARTAQSGAVHSQAALRHAPTGAVFSSAAVRCNEVAAPELHLESLFSAKADYVFAEFQLNLLVHHRPKKIGQRRLNEIYVYYHWRAILVISTHQSNILCLLFSPTHLMLQRSSTARVGTVCAWSPWVEVQSGRQGSHSTFPVPYVGLLLPLLERAF